MVGRLLLRVYKDLTCIADGRQTSLEMPARLGLEIQQAQLLDALPRRDSVKDW